MEIISPFRLIISVDEANPWGTILFVPRSAPTCGPHGRARRILRGRRSGPGSDAKEYTYCTRLGAENMIGVLA